MKKRPEIQDEAEQRSEKSKRFRSKKKNERRLGGKGLSLQAFANAKSNPSGYNPSIIKKQREFYRNAKYVSKYKKSLKQQSQSQSADHLPTTSRNEVDENKTVTKPRMNEKKKNSLQSLREDYEKRLAEEEKAKMEKEAIIQEKREERAKAEARRKVLKGKMFKKTRSGQPVMKYRIEHLLQKL